MFIHKGPNVCWIDGGNADSGGRWMRWQGCWELQIGSKKEEMIYMWVPDLTSMSCSKLFLSLSSPPRHEPGNINWWLGQLWPSIITKTGSEKNDKIVQVFDAFPLVLGCSFHVFVYLFLLLSAPSGPFKVLQDQQLSHTCTHCCCSQNLDILSSDFLFHFIYKVGPFNQLKQYILIHVHTDKGSYCVCSFAASCILVHVTHCVYPKE